MLLGNIFQNGQAVSTWYLQQIIFRAVHTIIIPYLFFLYLSEVRKFHGAHSCGALVAFQYSCAFQVSKVHTFMVSRIKTHVYFLCLPTELYANNMGLVASKFKFETQIYHMCTISCLKSSGAI